MKKQEPLVVVYDGHCALCRASMEKLYKMFGDQIREMDFRIVPPQEIHPELSEERCQAQMHVLKQGRVYGGAAAIAQVMRLHRFWRNVVWLYQIPPLGYLSEQVYKVISRNRFRISKWMGSEVECTDACSVHVPSKKQEHKSK